jgi:dihydroorotate dehydrogenase electron transfer subunit
MEQQTTGQLEDGRLMAQERIGEDYRRLVLNVPGVAARAQPGQFVHLRVPGLEDRLLRRPFSIYRVKGAELLLLYKTVGAGTRAMSELRPGAIVSVMGPLGRGFPLDRSASFPLLIGGGYGAAPLSFLAERLPGKGVVFLGGRTAADVLCLDDFKRLGWDVKIATEDGSLGDKGLVTAVLDRWLDSRGAAGTAPEIYACGPDGLLRALAQRAAARGLTAWLSMDRHMGCGAGVCLACVIRVKKAGAAGGETWARVCKEGPIFESREIAWEGGAPA